MLIEDRPYLNGEEYEGIQLRKTWGSATIYMACIMFSKFLNENIVK